MFGFYLHAILVIYLEVHAVIADEDLSVNIYPPSQKVVENGPAIFTCVSSVPGAQISWYQSQKRLSEEKDVLSIKRINDVMSVMRIENAQIKKHKKSYSCRVQSDDGRFAEKQANLKVISENRLHRYFPQIAPIVSDSDVSLPHRDPGTIHMKCETLVTLKKNKPSWRWIKDDFYDLSLDHEDENDDRIELTDDGDLIISGATFNDSGTYMCVAENNRGTAYGNPFAVTVRQGPKQDGCIDNMGIRSEYGESYNPGGDPCINCTCIEGGDLRCKSISCFPMQCPPGLKSVWLPERCCESVCIPDSDRTPGEDFEEPEETGDISKEIGETAGFCTDRDGRWVASGESYMPEEDPCLRCKCNNGRGDVCMMVACKAPICEHFLSSREMCCNYTCLPEPPRITDGCRDNSGRVVSDGDMFQPDSDPCKTCACINGQKGPCTQVACDAPTCRNYRLIPGTCCGFECLGEEIETVDIDLDDPFGNGEFYPPSADPCFSCTCSDGRPPACRSLGCRPPPHRPYPMPSSLKNAEKVLGHVFIQQIGSNDAFVQWKTPDRYSQMQTNLTVFYSKYSTNMNMRDVHAINIGNRAHAILRDLDPNSEYYIMVNGTLGNGTAFMTSRPARFSLDGRGRSSFVLSDAIGHVFESRGSIAYNGFSLPNEFDPVARTSDVKIVLNIASFHMVEVSRYKEEPCMNQECGLLRFYLYTMEGESRNVMSLMFTNEQDFTWAKAHL